ncbi:methyltransferase domain-containing protein [Streptomyces albiaxialis]|uniref:Methyltransferase domain-containing protein n=1 Tax=Streptomyces albiaxialis TaxID=329523 RepID=A0ABN2WXI4_9ACTN
MSDHTITEGPAGGRQSTLAKIAHMFRGTTDPDARVRSFYEVLDNIREDGFYREILGMESTYINYGYWADGCDDPDTACEALADELADAAGISEGDRVLDVGFGFAEQDFHWLRTRKPEKISGINVTPSQVQGARRRAEALGVADRLDLRVGSATALPFEDGSFDRVVALEASAHFDTRQKFFREALRVLRPGGVLATTDPLPRQGTVPKGGLMGRLDESRRKRVIPDANWYPRPVYEDQLRQAGYTQIQVRDITDSVLIPNAEHIRARCTRLLRDPRFSSFKQRNGIKWHLKVTELRAASRDYVISAAWKPHDRV